MDQDHSHQGDLDNSREGEDMVIEEEEQDSEVEVKVKVDLEVQGKTIHKMEREITQIQILVRERLSTLLKKKKLLVMLP